MNLSILDINVQCVLINRSNVPLEYFETLYEIRGQTYDYGFLFIFYEKLTAKFKDSKVCKKEPWI